MTDPSMIYDHIRERRHAEGRVTIHPDVSETTREAINIIVAYYNSRDNTKKRIQQWDLLDDAVEDWFLVLDQAGFFDAFQIQVNALRRKFKHRQEEEQGSREI